MRIAEIFRSYAEFDAHGRHVNGTDKESNHHYGDAYESLFPDRLAVTSLLEVGVADGSSLLAWQDIFPNAHIAGMDIHVAAKWPGEFVLGDQRLKADCEHAAAGRRWDVIIEDATHSTENTLLTLFWLWPYVAPGGLYIVEEWADVCSDRRRITSLFDAQILDTTGPSGGNEPLVVLRKPCR